MKTLDANYRITAQDVERAYKLLEKEFVECRTLTQQQLHLQDLGLDSEQMQRESGEYPTVKEVHDQWRQEAHEAERKRITSWVNEGRITAYDFGCYEKQVADGEADGPFATFMRVAAELQESGKHNLTVGDVRAEIRKR